MISAQVSASVPNMNGSSPHNTTVPSTANSGSNSMAKVIAMNSANPRRGNDRFGHSDRRHAGWSPLAKEKAPVFAGGYSDIR